MRPRLVAVTGYGQDSDRRQAGFDVHLVKPVLFERLQDAIVGAVAHYEHARLGLSTDGGSRDAASDLKLCFIANGVPPHRVSDLISLRQALSSLNLRSE